MAGVAIAAVLLGGMSCDFDFSDFFEGFTSFRCRAGERNRLGGVGRLLFVSTEVVRECTEGVG